MDYVKKALDFFVKKEPERRYQAGVCVREFIHLKHRRSNMKVRCDAAPFKNLTSLCYYWHITIHTHTYTYTLVSNTCLCCSIYIANFFREE